jgi:acetate---CoA ligase (ADP-forming)
MHSPQMTQNNHAVIHMRLQSLAFLVAPNYDAVQMTSASLSRLVFPKSITFIGGNECAVAIRRCKEFGFEGPIHAVHPKRDEVGDIATVKSVEDITGPIDAAFIAVKRELNPDIVRQLRAKGCGGAVIYAAGFAETGDGELQRDLLAAADGMPLMGPNCYGFVNGLGRVALWPDEHGIKPLERGIAIITQSGNIACNLTFTRRALPLAAVFAIGNQADVDMARMVDFLSADDRITAIGLHIEGLNNMPAFAAACEAARLRKKPVVVLKTGKSEQGAKVAMSHTSSLAGADSMYDALFRRHGVARCDTVTSFVETLKFLHLGALPGKSIVSLSCSGGEAALTADLALKHRLDFRQFDLATITRVRSTLNDLVTISNPFDYHTFIWGQPEAMTATFTATLSGGFDVGMLILDSPPPPLNSSAWYVAARAFAAAAKANKARAAVVATLPECMPLEMAEELMAAGVAPMFGHDEALTAFENAAIVGAAHADMTKRPILRQAQLKDATSRVLKERDAKDLLSTFGLTVPKGVTCKTNDAVKSADRVGYPVTLKISSDAIAHKTEAGGVALNLKTANEVKAAAARMAKLGDEVLVEQMISGAVAELIIGVTRDPQFGLGLVIGAGGVLTELLQDSTTLLLPTNRAEIETALHSLKVWKLISGFRGKSGDTEATIAAVEAIARFAEAHADTLEELDVNPLLVLPKGAVAVDALVNIKT